MFSVLIIDKMEVIFRGKARSAILPGEEGEFEILDFHCDILSLLKEGNVVIDGSFYPIEKGVMKFCNEELVVVVKL